MKFALIILTLLSVTFPCLAKTRITVGAYEFTPYFYLLPSGHQTGITVETVRLLNSLQKEYTFEIMQMPANRRYQFFERKRADLILFEDPAWEWAKYKYEFLPLEVEDGEVYVTRAGTSSPKSFEELRKMKIAIVRGYHYSFAGFDADERFLKKNFTVELAENPEACLNLVTRGISDVTVVAKSFIYDFLRRNPSYRDKITVSNNYDSVYRLGLILNPKGRISRAKLEPIIAKLKKQPEFQKLIAERFQLK